MLGRDELDFTALSLSMHCGETTVPDCSEAPYDISPTLYPSPLTVAFPRPGQEERLAVVSQKRCLCITLTVGT